MNASRIISNLKRSSCLTSVALLALAATQPVKANPVNGTVVVGTATITAPDPSLLIIDQSTNSAIINWDSFNVGVGETTQFVLPDADSWTLNRVVGSQDPSLIYGAIISNGNLVIVNPDGLFFGAGSTVDVNRLIATTADISNEDFSSGNLTFGIAGNPFASIVNEGNITAADYGLAAFIAPSVRNSGIITARLGTVSLASGNTFTIDPYGDGLIKLAIGDEIAGDVYDVATGQVVSDLVSNDGTLSADGGVVAMTAATARVAVNSVINNTGVIEARSVGVQGGRIILGGSTAAVKAPDAPAQTVRVSGTLNATGIDELFPVSDGLTGGHIQVTGEAILVTNATIDASGRDGGGTVLIGGDYLGGNATNEKVAEYGITMEDYSVANASVVFLDEDSVVAADGLVNGDGGKVVVWSDDLTASAATVSARGGQVSGNGGFIETSGGFLDIQSAADASASNGEVGTWLIDPYNITIGSSSSGSQGTYGSTITITDAYFSNYIGSGVFNADYFYPTSSGSVLDDAVVEAALNSGTSVLVTTWGAPGSGSGNIRLATSITKTSGGEAMLVLDAAGDVRISSGVNITSTSGKLWVALQAVEGSISANNIGELDLNGGGIALIAQDDISMTSNYDMPDLAVVVNPNGNSIGTRSVNISFGNDDIQFDFTNDAAVFSTGGTNLADTSANQNVYIDLGGLDLIVSNMSIVDRLDKLDLVWTGTMGVTVSDMLDGIPELVKVYSTGALDYINYLNGPEPSPFGAVIELSGDGNNSVDLYMVSASSGTAVLDTYLNPPTAIVPPAILNPETTLEKATEYQLASLGSLFSWLFPPDPWIVLAEISVRTDLNKAIVGTLGGGLSWVGRAQTATDIQLALSDLSGSLRLKNRSVVRAYYSNGASYSDIVDAVLDDGLFSRTDNFQIGRAFSSEGRSDVLNDRKFVEALVTAVLFEDGKISF